MTQLRFPVRLPACRPGRAADASRTARRVGLGAVLVAAATLAACSSGTSGGAAATAPGSVAPGSSAPGSVAPVSVAPVSVASGPGASAAAAGSGTLITATETEFAIALSATSFTAGTYTFHVKNAGQITHALTVDGPGVEDKSTGDLAPGASATLKLTLRAGKYDVYCPVGDHKMEGMDETVQVS